jgi:hypothetical protein
LKQRNQASARFIGGHFRQQNACVSDLTQRLERVFDFCQGFDSEGTRRTIVSCVVKDPNGLFSIGLTWAVIFKVIVGCYFSGPIFVLLDYIFEIHDSLMSESMPFLVFFNK